MRSVGSEAPQLLESSLQPPEHRIQYRSKSSQLVFPVLDRQPGSQILCGYFFAFRGSSRQSVPVLCEPGAYPPKPASNTPRGSPMSRTVVNSRMFAPHRLLVVGNPKNNYGVVEMVWAAGEPDSQTVRKTLGDWDDVFPCLFPRGVVLPVPAQGVAEYDRGACLPTTKSRRTYASPGSPSSP